MPPTFAALAPGGVAVSRKTLPGGIVITEHELLVPLDHASPDGKTISLFVREVAKAGKEKDDAMPFILYLQGGPGFPSPRVSAPPGGWMKVALDSFRVLLFDQRGTGRSTPATPQHILSIGSPEAQADYMCHFRADSIVNDCEIVRDKIAGGKKLTLIGQSFGGFCMLRYLSAYPDAIERCLFTCGLAPVGKPVEEVYRATFKRMEKRNARFYRRYPDEIENVRDLVRILHTSPAKLPHGGTLTARRFLSLGLMLGSGAGLEKLHDLLELAKAPGAPAGELPELFLRGVDDAEAFSTNPIYWLLHESIYCDGPGSASAWAAERVQASLPAFDYTQRLDKGAEPILFTGEMVYKWMGEDYSALRPLAPAAELLANKADWPKLYDMKNLGKSDAECGALMSYDDIYVEREFSEDTAAMLRSCRVWVSNEFQHSGLHDDGERVFEKIMAMSKGEVEFGIWSLSGVVG